MERNRSSRRDVDDERGSSRRESSRGSDRDEDRGSRRREPDRDEDRGSRGREERSGSRRGSDRDEEERGSSRRGGGSSYEYVARSAEQTRSRASKGANDYDKIIKDGIKTWKPNDGDNRIRILPPTWKKPEHFGLDIYVHYGVGADRGQYLCRHKMLGEADPINEEREKFKASMDPDSKEDQKYLKDLEAKRRVGVYLIDRDHEKEGVQFWAMPWTIDRDIVKVSVDKDSGEVLPIDHPDDGYDITFEKSGAKDRTEYNGVAIARRSSPLGKDAWLEFAQENPIPEILQYFPYEDIAKAFGGVGAHKEKGRGSDRDEDRGRDSDRRGRDDDRDPPARGGRDRDEDRPARGASRDDPPALTWESIHEMTLRELKDVIEDEDLDINPKEAKDDEDLADWICDELKLEKKKASGRRAVDNSDDEASDKLRAMRNRRED